MRIGFSGARGRAVAVLATVVVAFGAGFGIDHLTYSGSGQAADSLTETATTRTVPIEDASANDPIPSPPPNGSTVSFLATTPTHTIDKGLHAHTFEESCPDGWYVRPAQPDVSVPTSLNAAWIEHKSSSWIKSQDETNSTSGFYEPSNTWSVFQSFTAKYTNMSADSSHSIYLQYWCDKVPSWYSTASTTTGSGSAASGVKTPAGVASASAAPLKGGGPVGYSCWYCSFAEMTLTNLGTGLNLDWSNATSGAPLLVQPGGGNQQWYLSGGNGGSDFQYGIATMGLWRETGALLDWAIAENPSTGQVSFTDGSSGEPPNDGDWYYINQAAGLTYNATWLVNTQTGDCLTAAGGAGSQVTGAPCDATNKAQWWVTSQPTS